MPITRVEKVDPLNPSMNSIEQAAKLIQRGELVAFPTETVYGLGADATSSSALSKIFEVKNRPSDNPLIVHVHSKEMAMKCTSSWPIIANRLVERFWPGPLSLILPRSGFVSADVSKGLDTVAIRMPAHMVALKLIEMAETPIAAPSANISGKPSPTKASHVFADLKGKIPFILDGGSTLVGVESTVVSLVTDPPMLLRPGGITVEELKQIVPNLQVLEHFKSDKPLSPGMKYKHYSPEKKLVLIRNSWKLSGSEIDDIVDRDNNVILFCMNGTHKHKIKSIKLGSNLKEIQANLFSALRLLDESNYAVGYIEDVEQKLEGLTIMNRLEKAAHRQIEH